MLFFLSHGYRVVAHDRRGHGRSSQVGTGHDMDHYASDASAVVEHLDLRNAIHVGHSTGGGEVARYVVKYGEPQRRVAKAVLISSVPPLMLKTAKNPGSTPIEVFDGFRKTLAENLNGLDLQRRMATDRINMPIIFVTGYADVPKAVQAMKTGAVEFLDKPFSDQRLLDAIGHSLERSRAGLIREAELHSLQQRYATLSRREREVMTLVVAGRLNKQIGYALGISEITVKAHRGSMMRKIGAESLAELVHMAAKLQVDPTPADPQGAAGVPKGTILGISPSCGVVSPFRSNRHSSM